MRHTPSKPTRRPSWVALLGIILTTFAAQPAAALDVDALHDEFDGEWKSCLWEGYQRFGGDVHRDGEAGYDANLNTVRNNRLDLKVPANYLAGMSWETGLESTYMLGGDFDVQVDFFLPDTEYWTNLDMRGVNLLFVELMANDAGARRRQSRNSQLNPNTTQAVFNPHLWVANEAKDQVTQIDTDNAVILGVYPTGNSPSRTSVDLLGDVWINHRCDSTLWRIRASECSPPNCSVAQVNANYKDRFTTPYSNGRCNGGGVAVDKDNNPWFGFLNDRKVVKVDRSTGAVVRATSVPGRVYGLAVDVNDYIWSDEHWDDWLSKIDALTGTRIGSFRPNDGKCFNPYGIAVDSFGKIWNSHWGGCPYLTRFDPVTETFDRFSVPGGTSILSHNRGIAADNQGLIWTVSSTNSKLSVFNMETGAYITSYNTCATPTGVALDRNNRVWTACRGGNGTVWQHDRDGTVLSTHNVDGAVYSYSDMTGYQLRNFGSDAWKEDFLVNNRTSTDSYYISSVENNYGGGIEQGGGGNTQIDPSQAPVNNLTIVDSAFTYQINRMAFGELHYTDRLSRVISQPSTLEGMWGVRTPNEDRLNKAAEVFTVDAVEDLDVYVAYDADASALPAWLDPATSSYAEVSGELVTVTEPQTPEFKLYKRTYNSGDKISFGGNLASATTTVSTYASCAEVLRTNPLAPSGTYTINTGVGGDQSVYCDMESDGGVGHTMVRVNLPPAQSNSGDVQDYKDACAAIGMELIVPRSKSHAEKIVEHFGEPPNLVNVYPKSAGARGLHNWEGRCQGQPCNFYMSPDDNANCGASWTEPSGDNSVNAPLYRWSTGGDLGCGFGRWNDTPTGAVQTGLRGWVMCSTNDAYIPPARSCDEIAFNGSHANVSPEGTSGAYSLISQSGVAYDAYCDMKHDGGGWTLGIKVDGRSSRFHYDSSYWTDGALYNQTQPNLDGQEAKLYSFMNVPFNQLMLASANSYSSGAAIPYNNFRRVNLNVNASSMSALFNGGYRYVNPPDRNGWKNLVPGSSLQWNCNRRGINVGNSYSRVRVGIVGNNENDCNTPDSRIGIGGRGGACGQRNNLTSGNTARCGGDNGNRDIRTMGALFARNRPAELVGHWPMNNDTNDYSGNGNDGARFNGANFNAGGVSGQSTDQAIEFDGTNDYMRVPDSSSLDNQSMTLSFWVYLDSDPNINGNNNWRSLIRKGSTAGTTSGFDVVLEEWGNRAIAFDTGHTGGSDRWWPNRMSVPIGEWTHITLAYDALTGVKYAWQDGRLLDTKTVNLGPLRTNNEPVFMSNNVNPAGGGSGAFDGKLDDVRIYDGLIPESMVKRLSGTTRGINLANYFVYFVPKAFTEPPPSPGAFTIIEDPVRDAADNPKTTLEDSGKLRIVRNGSMWSFYYADGASGATVWKLMGSPLDLGTDNVRMRLRTRLDPFWHSGPVNNPGGALSLQYDNYRVNSADEVIGGPVETCNGIDDDCDGIIDETFPGDGDECSTGLPGVCEEGYLTCVAGTVICDRVNDPSDEVCDGLDNDCDGEVDNYVGGGDTADGTYVTTGESCEDGSLQGPCRAGQYVCDMGTMVCQGAVSPQPDICDGIDNDCDGEVDNTANHVFNRLGRRIVAKQRSMPFIWPRPVEGTLPFFTDDGDDTDDFAQYDGASSQAPVHGLRKARIVFYLDPTLADGPNPEGKYVLWLTQGVSDPSQGAGTTSWAIRHKNTKNFDVLLNDSNESNIGAGSSDKYQKFVVTNEAGSTGGVAIGPLDAHKEWELDLSGSFSGDIDAIELYNAETGTHTEIRPTETLTIENQTVPSSGLLISADTGVPCAVPGGDGVCAVGTGFCDTNCDAMGNCTGTLQCNQTVTPQPEICDGLDNNCNGTVDGESELVFPIIEVKQDGHPEIGDWTWVPTIGNGTSAEQTLNFQEASPGDDLYGWPEVPSVEDPLLSIQAIESSVVTFHRDLRPADGSLAMLMLHGKHEEDADANVPPATSLQLTLDKLPEEMFSIVYDDRGGSAPDAVPSGFNPTTFEMQWTLLREDVGGGNFARDADSGIIRDIFEDTFAGSNEYSLTVDDFGNLTEWNLYRPYRPTIVLDQGQELDVRARATMGNDAICVIQDHPKDECLGELSTFVCVNGQVQCHDNPNGCCKDRDGDGFYGYDALSCDIGTDCDDDDAAVYPGADEICDGIDNNCAGIDATGMACSWLDGGTCNTVDEVFPEQGMACEGNYDEDGNEVPGGGYDYDANGDLVLVTNTGECSAIMICDAGDLRCNITGSPTAEICDGLDNDCDGIVDGSDLTGSSDTSVPDECRSGDITCGPRECEFQNVCVCRDGLTGADNCQCAEGLAPSVGGMVTRACPPDSLFDGEKCLAVCDSDSDCEAGFVCDDATRACVEGAGNGAAPDGASQAAAPQNCSVTSPANQTPVPWELGGLALLGSAWFWRRRRDG